MYERELETICRTAREAGSLVMEYYRADSYAVETKSDASPVTDADRAAELAMREILGKERPAD